jgi:hypothetical protein
VVEGNGGRTNVTFNVGLTSGASNGVSVSYETLDATAAAGSDYVPRSGSLYFPPGTTNLALSIPVLGDTRHETDESFVLLLSGVANALLGVNEVAGRIMNDDAEPLLAVLSLKRAGNLWRVRFSSGAGKSYRLQRADTLPAASWSTIVDQIPGTGDIVEVLDSTVSGSQAFYRVQTLP